MSFDKQLKYILRYYSITFTSTKPDYRDLVYFNVLANAKGKKLGTYLFCAKKGKLDEEDNFGLFDYIKYMVKLIVI